MSFRLGIPLCGSQMNPSILSISIIVLCSVHIQTFLALLERSGVFPKVRFGESRR